MKLIHPIQSRRPIRTALVALLAAAVPAGALAAPASADARANPISLVSVGLNGGGGDGASGLDGRPGVSSGGRFVVFSSYASDLVAGDTNGQRDVFVRDTATGRTTLVSVGVGGVQGNAESRQGSISADGRFVAFNSYASNLLPGDTNDSPDVFLRDLVTGRTTLVSVGLQGWADQGAHEPGISTDGRHVAFTSSATNLVAGDTNDTQDIFVRDLHAGRTERVSLTAEGLQSDLPSAQPAISGNGLVVAFTAIGGGGEIQVRDRTANTTRVISDGVPADPRAFVVEPESAAVSADGRFVVFTVIGWLGVGVDPIANVWLRDLRTNELQLISADHLGRPSSAIGAATGDVSADGRYVTFGTKGQTSRADQGALSDVYRLDRKTGALVWITHRQDQTDPYGGRNGSYSPAISDDGHHVAFDSDDKRLVRGGGTSGYDVYRWSSAG
ncbi:PD40 domain-containing protein [Kribbella sancticallisti]|uniref:PD40 domain-containing protein n=1 Tax=Kribbella sancticallisti TaxID=460087 RepID=A0ABN2DWT6_9ACTN